MEEFSLQNMRNNCSQYYHGLLKILVTQFWQSFVQYLYQLLVVNKTLRGCIIFNLQCAKKTVANFRFSFVPSPRSLEMPRSLEPQVIEIQTVNLVIIPH